MSKKLICLFLSLIMLLGVCLTACGEKDDEDAKADIADKASEAAVTLTMYLMSEKPVDADTVADIEEAVNKITENKFKTRLKLYYYTEAEYYQKLDASFAERDERKANGTLISSKQEAETGEDETFVNEYGIVEIKYPSVTGYQVDIFYMGGKDKFDKYKNDGRLTRLDDEINSSSKDLTTNIPSQFLSNMKTLNKGTYAIPTSKTIGEYTYLLLNKKAMTDLYLRNESGSTTYEDYTSLTCEKVKDFLNAVKTNSALSQSYYPLYTNFTDKELLMSNLKYWGVDEDGELSDTFSVLGGYFGANDDYLDVNKYAKIENLFENEQFLYDLRTLMSYKEGGYYDAVDGKDFAVGYVSGGAELVETYGDEYELVPVELPRLTEDEIYSDMFAVCSYTANVGRSMKVLTLLNTDENFRNLILYGIEDEHYKLVTKLVPDEDGEMVPAIDKYGDPIKYVERFEIGEAKYMMDINKTGNTLLATPLGEENIMLRDYGIIQNQTAKVVLDLGFSLTANGFEVDVESLKEVSVLSKAVYDKILKCNTVVELDAVIAEAQTLIDESDAVAAHLACELGAAHETDGTLKNSEDRCGSLCCCYEAWLKANKIIK